MTTFKKVLIANRGEIAVRIIRTLNKLGIAPVVVYSLQDKESLFVSMTAEKYLLHENSTKEPYLDIDQIVEIAHKSGVDAIHPGYGFLAENPLMAESCIKKGITFIGPSASVIRLMGNKLQANGHVASLGLPVIPGINAEQENLEENTPDDLFPVMLKAVAGGGGRGIRWVSSKNEFKQALSEVKREALAYFGDDRVYVEKFMDHVRHIEVQILGDGNGNAVHLYERECTIQRRNQKILEEAPSPTLSPPQREQLCQMAVNIATSVKYKGAGTVEFLLQYEKDFYFLEMNTRIQVEHPATEIITGRDLIADQLHIAMHGTLPFKQTEISIEGHAIEARIYAEDPEDDFNPAPGQILLYKEPKGNGIRVDSGINDKVYISGNYDPMIGKLIVHSGQRDQCIEKLKSALRNFTILGIKTNIDYLLTITGHQQFKDNQLDITYIKNHHEELLKALNNNRNLIPDQLPLIAYTIALSDNKKNISNNVSSNRLAGIIGYWRQQPFSSLKFRDRAFYVLSSNFEKTLNIYINDDVYAVRKVKDKKGMLSFTYGKEDFEVVYSFDHLQNLHCRIKGYSFVVLNALTSFERPHVKGNLQQNGDLETINAPMHGKIIFIGAKELQQVKKGDVLVVIEAMKMENNIIAPRDAVIKKVNITNGSQVEKNMSLMVLQ